MIGVRVPFAPLSRHLITGTRARSQTRTQIPLKPTHTLKTHAARVQTIRSSLCGVRLCDTFDEWEIWTARLCVKDRASRGRLHVRKCGDHTTYRDYTDEERSQLVRFYFGRRFAASSNKSLTIINTDARSSCHSQRWRRFKVSVCVWKPNIGRYIVRNLYKYCAMFECVCDAEKTRKVCAKIYL